MNRIMVTQTEPNWTKLNQSFASQPVTNTTLFRDKLTPLWNEQQELSLCSNYTVISVVQFNHKSTPFIGLLTFPWLLNSKCKCKSEYNFAMQPTLYFHMSPLIFFNFRNIMCSQVQMSLVFDLFFHNAKFLKFTLKTTLSEAVGGPALEDNLTRKSMAIFIPNSMKFFCGISSSVQLSGVFRWCGVLVNLVVCLFFLEKLRIFKFQRPLE